jgi:phage-related protein (TIGR01555 family)
MIRAVFDGFSSLFQGYGKKAYDSSVSTEFVVGQRIDDRTLKNILETEGIGKKTVTIQTSDMLKEGFIVPFDTDGLILKKMNELKWKKIFNKALMWDLGIGGSVIYMGIDDGEEPDQPVNRDKIKSVQWLKAYDKTQVQWTTQDLYQDKNDPKYGEVEVYTITPSTLTNDIQIRVHESRILMFDGEEVTNETRIQNNGWGDSIFQAAYKQLEGLSVSWGYCYRIATRFIAEVLKIDNLFHLAQSKDGTKQIQERLAVRDLTRGNLRTELIDLNEEFDLKSVNINGYTDLVTKSEIAYASVMGIPLTKLYEQSPGGLNSTGKGEEKVYYDKIEGMQELKLKDPIEGLAEYIMLSQDGDFNGTIPEDYGGITFNPVMQQTQEEILKNKKLHAETTAIEIDKQVLFPDEVRQSKYGGNEYSYEIMIDDSMEVSQEELEDEEDQ